MTVVGAVKHERDLQTPPGQEGVAEVLERLYSYGTQTLDRLAFQKALDDIAANESAGYSFSVKVLKEHFSRGVQLLADNELHPALPAQAFEVVQKADRAVCGGESEEPRIPHLACAGSGAAARRRSGAAGGDAGNGCKRDPGRCEAVSRGDRAAGPDDDRGDRGRDAGGGEDGHREMVWRLEGDGAEAEHDAAGRFR